MGKTKYDTYIKLLTFPTGKILPHNARTASTNIVQVPGKSSQSIRVSEIVHLALVDFISVLEKSSAASAGRRLLCITSAVSYQACDG